MTNAKLCQILRELAGGTETAALQFVIKDRGYNLYDISPDLYNRAEQLLYKVKHNQYDDIEPSLWYDLLLFNFDMYIDKCPVDVIAKIISYTAGYGPISIFWPHYKNHPLCKLAML